jgi:hypothetical protein
MSTHCAGRHDVVHCVLAAEVKQEIVNLVEPILGFFPEHNRKVFSALISKGSLSDMRVFFFACLNIFADIKAWVAFPTQPGPRGTKVEHEAYARLTGTDGFFISLHRETDIWMQKGCLTTDRYLDGIIEAYVLRHAA